MPWHPLPGCFELIDEKTMIEDREDATVLRGAKGSVDLEQVCFSYTPEKKLIEDFNLSVQPGQRVAIVGPTGCGKTTIINLLMRFYDVDSGAIKVEGTDIRDVTRESLRTSYGMVLQDTWLKSGTIRDNIAYGHPNATEEEIIQQPDRPMPMDLSCGCRMDMPLLSVRTEGTCPRDRNSFSVLPGLCCAFLPCSYWTRPHPPLTPGQRLRCRRPLRR